MTNDIAAQEFYSKREGRREPLIRWLSGHPRLWALLHMRRPFFPRGWQP